MEFPPINSQSPARKLASLNLARCCQPTQLNLDTQPVDDNSETQRVALEDEVTLRIDPEDEEWERILEELNNGVEEVKEPSRCNEYVFDEVAVKFPYDAYESQKQVMEGLIKGALAGHNCLLESPTGTGKTAALLCALIGLKDWVLKNRFKLPYSPTDKCTCGLISDPDDLSNTTLSHRMELIGSGPGKKKWMTTIVANTATLDVPVSASQPEEESSPKKVKRSEDLLLEQLESQMETSTSEMEGTREKLIEDVCQFCITKSRAPVKPPTIYYATRTHSQIAQVVKQLKNSPYKDTVRMAILSSRNQSCLFAENAIEEANYTGESEQTTSTVKAEVQEAYLKPVKIDNLDDACATLKNNYFFNEKLKEGKVAGSSKSKKEPTMKPICPYYNYGSEFKGIYDQVRQLTHDIEDLMEFGKENQCCAFYGSKYLHTEAELIICPYNYIVHPGIREAADINLCGSIIVFDEAHNIEDVCREVSSLDIDSTRMRSYIQIIDSILVSVEKGFLTLHPSIDQSLKFFSTSLTSFLCWISTQGNKLAQVKRPYSSSLEGQADSADGMGFKIEDVVSVLSKAGLGPDEIKMSHHSHDTAFLDEDDQPNFAEPIDDTDEHGTNKPRKSPLPKRVRKFVQSLINQLDIVYRNQADFVMTLKRKDIGKTDLTDDFILSIKCLNPALAFSSIVAETLSVVVASGTLSPQTSFEGELKTKFEIKLSASHVIESHQVWKGVFSLGVDQNLMNLNSKNQQNLMVQDDIGKSIVEICKAVPNGILVFLPSYRFMSTLKVRWTTKLNAAEDPILTQIAKVKTIFYEQSRDKEQFKSDMQNFKSLACRKPGETEVTGAILFAVFRGKVSEGIDFSDEQARAVISVGIPYPPARAFEIVSKQRYNTERYPSLIKGDTWYEVQAFRAMNQAFGRCIRHKEDWGAIVIMDARFKKNSKYASEVSYLTKNLSRWVQDDIKTPVNFRQFISSLKWFMGKQQNGGGSGK